MDVTIQFNYYVHSPLYARFHKAFETSLTSDNKEVKLRVIPPRRFLTHTLTTPDGEIRVRDAALIIQASADLRKDQDEFASVVRAVDRLSTPFFAALRGHSRAPQMDVRGVRDLEFIGIFILSAGGRLRRLNDWSTDFQEVLSRSEWAPQADLPLLPMVTSKAWQATIGNDAEGEAALEHWRRSTPLHESLVLDAEAALRTDPRTAILFAAIACETFIINHLRNRGQSNRAHRGLLDFLEPPGGEEPDWKRPSVRRYFDQIARIVLGESLKDSDRSLFDRLNRLFDARNDISHRGTIRDNINPPELVNAAQEAIRWASAK